jgi:hypothetical protein
VSRAAIIALFCVAAAMTVTLAFARLLRRIHRPRACTVPGLPVDGWLDEWERVRWDGIMQAALAEALAEHAAETGEAG